MISNITYTRMRALTRTHMHALLFVYALYIFMKQSDVSAAMASAKPIKVQMHGDADGIASSILTGNYKIETRINIRHIVIDALKAEINNK